jgi:hypothetical protein
MGEEAKIERYVCDYVLRKFGVLNVKMLVRGYPDRMFLIPGGQVLFIEFKALSGRVGALQEHRHKELSKLGFKIEVHNDKETAIAAIKHCLEAAQLSK